ncbi:ankyrin repeat domain-containing protein SOWAHC-like [Leuresthes tenuis]|uniref:ankyrin repeat domain-containing protein SOWAHC-like n=1 Tax=Leuresthes tenuis TaxID=355514 RepID=UPI003B50FD83
MDAVSPVMAAEFSQDAIVSFIKERGGRVRSAELVERFKAAFPEEPRGRAAARHTFKHYVDNVAYVKTESGVKQVYLKRAFRGSQPVPGELRKPEKGAPGQVSGDAAPGSSYGNGKERVPHSFPPESRLPDRRDEKSACQEFVCAGEQVGSSSSGEMGNTDSVTRRRNDSKKEPAGNIPEIAVIEASPLPVDGSAFTLPGPAAQGPLKGPPEDPPARPPEQAARQQESQDTEDEWHSDGQSLSGSEDNSTPRGSRKHFIEVMMSSSTQVRRSLVLRSSVYLPPTSDSDSASLASSSPDDDRTPVSLEPVEHEWMMCASDGEWGSLHRLLATEPSLVLRRDFITGFTCLHWAAKHGRPELMALIMNFAEQHELPISVDVRSNTGYTPLHIAAMHSHMEVVKLLVGAYNADVELRDYSGRKACQYLTDSASVDIRDIIGAYEQAKCENAARREGGRWRFSEVLQSSLKPLRVLNPSNCDSADGEDRPREKPIRRKSSLSKMRPKLQRLRMRTSQLGRSSSFHDREEPEASNKGSNKGSFRARPKTHWFGLDLF